MFTGLLVCSEGERCGEGDNKSNNSKTFDIWKSKPIQTPAEETLRTSHTVDDACTDSSPCSR
jgi:hypothetical protein